LSGCPIRATISVVTVSPPCKSRWSRDSIAESLQRTSDVRNQRQKTLLICEIAKSQIQDIENAFARSRQLIAESQKLCEEAQKASRRRAG
jgi:hypothetical protein